MNRRPTLTRYLIDERRRFPHAEGELNALILDVSIACKASARSVAAGVLAGDRAPASPAPAVNVQGELQKPLDVLSNELFLQMNEGSGHVAGLASEEMDEPRDVAPGTPRGKYLLVFDPLDGSGNLDLNVAVGSIFSILRAPQEALDSGRALTEADFLQPGAAQVAAGYALYGPATMFMLTVGNGVAGFTLDPDLGEFVLTHPHVRVPEQTQEFAINSSNGRFWEPPVRRYVEECVAGQSGPRGKDFNMRWIACVVAEAHRILTRGGVFLYPRDTRDPGRAGRLRLLYEANPIGFLVEQAGGRASTGHQPVLDVPPGRLHQRIGFVFGSRAEVERIERYHRDTDADEAPLPLFAARTLFRD